MIRRHTRCFSEGNHDHLRVWMQRWTLRILRICQTCQIFQWGSPCKKPMLKKKQYKRFQSKKIVRLRVMPAKKLLPSHQCSSPWRHEKTCKLYTVAKAILSVFARICLRGLLNFLDLRPTLEYELLFSLGILRRECNNQPTNQPTDKQTNKQTTTTTNSLCLYRIKWNFFFYGGIESNCILMPEKRGHYSSSVFILCSGAEKLVGVK